MSLINALAHEPRTPKICNARPARSSSGFFATPYLLSFRVLTDKTVYDVVPVAVPRRDIVEVLEDPGYLQSVLRTLDPQRADEALEVAHVVPLKLCFVENQQCELGRFASGVNRPVDELRSRR
jgi:hypothetical protein